MMNEDLAELRRKLCSAEVGAGMSAIKAVLVNSELPVPSSATDLNIGATDLIRNFAFKNPAVPNAIRFPELLLLDNRDRDATHSASAEVLSAISELQGVINRWHDFEDTAGRGYQAG